MGEGQAALLSGEPGIGKSRILRALADAPGEGGTTALRCQCSPFYVNSAFYPIIDTLERTLRFTTSRYARPLLDISLPVLSR